MLVLTQGRATSPTATGAQPDPIAFAHSLAFKPDAWQAQLLQWNGKQILLNCARQSGKSTTTSLLAVYKAVYNPGSLILLISPSLRQSSELFRKVADWLSRIPDMPRLLEDNRLSCTLANHSRIISLPSSEATIRGYSAVSLAIFDEASRIDDQLYFSVRPMLAISGGGLIAMSTPFGKRGWWWTAWSNGGDEWSRIQVHASQNPRISKEFLESERRALGDWWWLQEYDCTFQEQIGSVFSYDVVMDAMSDKIMPLFGGLTSDNAIDKTIEVLVF